MKKILMITLVGFFLIVGLYVGATFISEQPLINIFGGDAPNTFGFSEEVNWGGDAELLTDLVAYYDFDTTTGNLIDSTGNYDLTEYGTVPSDAGIRNNSRGVYSHSNYFNGSAGLPSIDHDDSWTDNIWINRTGSTASEVRFLSKSGTANQLFYILTLTTSEKLQVLMGETTVGSSVEITSAGSLPLNDWAMVTLAYNGTSKIATAYIDGVSVGTDTMTETPNPSDFLSIGVGHPYATSVNPFLNGLLDEYGYFNKTLNPAEISILYNGGKGLAYPFGVGTITLNSPADDSVSPLPETTFNATANITSGGAFLTNMSLYTNETGSWALRNTTNLVAVEGTGEQGANLEVVNSGGDYTMAFTSATTSGIVKSIQLGSSDGTSLSSNVSIIQNGVTLAYKETASYVYNTAPLVTFNVEDYSDHIYSAVDSGNFQVKVERIGGSGGQGVKTSASSFSGSLFSYSSQAMTGRHSGQPAVPIITFNQTTPNVASSTQTWTRSGLSGIFDWNVEACDTDGDCGFGISNFTVISDTIDPVVTIFEPIEVLNYSEVGGNQLLNFTAVNGGSLEACWFDYNGTNNSVNCNVPLNFTMEPNNFNLTVYANDSAGNEGSNFTSWEYKVLLNTLTFPNLTTEGNIDDFTYAIKTGTGLSVATANFYYNGASSSASVNSLGDNLYNLTISHLAPTLTSDANFTFLMEINLDDGFSVNTSSNNQTVLNVGIDNCSTNTIAILNYTLVDEDTQIPLVPADNGTIEIDLSLYSTDGSLLITTFNETFSKTNNASVCISDDTLNSSSYSLYSIARYTGADYSEEYSHIQNLTLNNESGTEEVTLFDLLTARSTDFLITFKDANFLPVSDAIIQVERQYVGEGVFKSVEAPLTSSEGRTVAHLIRNDMTYNFVVLKNGIILGTFNNLVAFCDDIVAENCNIQLNLLSGSGQIYDYDSAVGIAYDLSYNETTRVLSVPFTTTSGGPANVSIYAVKFDQLGETEACSTALVSASATLTCTIPVALSNETISYVISVDSVPTLQGFFSLGNPLELGDAGYFLLLILVISLALMFVESKTMTIIAVMLGFITSSMLFFIQGGILGPATAITWLIISGLILIYQLNSNGRT